MKLSSEMMVAVVAGVAVSVVLAVSLAFLTAYPPVFIDEPWYANAAWTWLAAGVNFDTMHSGVLDQLGSDWVRWPILGNLPLLGSFALLGLGLFQARAVSWLFGVILLLLTFLVGRRSYGVASGALAAVLLSLSPPFLQASHYVRPDVMLATLVMASFLVALKAIEDDRNWAHLAAGLVLGLGLDVHFNVSAFALGMGAVYLAAYGKRLLRVRGAWLFVLGGLIGVGYYVAGHVLPNPSTFVAINAFSLGTTHVLPISSLNPLDLLRSARGEIGRFHFYDNNLDFGLIGASFLYLVVRRRNTDRLLLVFVAVALAGFVLFVGNKHDVYAILFYPLLLLAVAETLVSMLRASGGWGPQGAFVLGLLMLVLVNGAEHFARPLARDRDYDYYAITEQIRAVVPDRARVVGLPTWWLGLADYDYRSTLGLTYLHVQNGYTLTEGMEALRPDVLIVDSALRGLLVEQGGFSAGPGFDLYRLPRGEFEHFLRQRGTKVTEFSDQWHGRFEIYKIQWDGRGPRVFVGDSGPDVRRCPRCDDAELGVGSSGVRCPDGVETRPCWARAQAQVPNG